MTDNDIDAIRQREQAATPGPWRAHTTYPHTVWQGPEDADDPGIISTTLAHEVVADAEFIAHARTDVPALLGIAAAAEYKSGAQPCVEGECEHAAEVDDSAPEDAPCPLVETRYATADDVIERDALLAKVDELTAERDNLTAYNRAVKGANEDLREQLTAANRHADGLEADLRSAVKGLRESEAHIQVLEARLGEPGPKQYLIWSHRQQAWWGPGGHGYRWDICRAGRFPLNRATDHASTRTWPTNATTPPEVIVPAPPLHVLADPERIGDWIDEQIKTATDAKIAARKAEQPAEATR